MDKIKTKKNNNIDKFRVKYPGTSGTQAQGPDPWTLPLKKDWEKINKNFNTFPPFEERVIAVSEIAVSEITNSVSINFIDINHVGDVVNYHGNSSFDIEMVPIPGDPSFTKKDKIINIIGSYIEPQEYKESVSYKLYELKL